MRQTIPTYTTYLNQLLEVAKRQGYIQFLITFKNMVEGVYFDLTNTSYNMYEEEYEWKILIKKEINPLAKQRKEKYLCLYTEEKV